MPGIRPTICHFGFFIFLIALSASATEISGKIVLRKAPGGKTVDRGGYDLRGVALTAAAQPEKRGRFDHVAVWLETKQSASVPPLTAKMEQISRQFQPDFLVVPIGSTVEFPNLDPIFHNIFSLSHSKAFDLGYYAQGKSRAVTFSRPGVVQVYCHIHTGMYGVIVVAPGGWFTVPGPSGFFSFDGIPAGEYSLAVWQRASGLVRKKLVAPDSGTLPVTVVLPEESDK